MADFTEAQWAELQRSRNASGTPTAVLSSPARGGRQRHEDGKMNKREAAYAHFLQLRKQVGEIREWRFEALRFKMAPNTHLKPDFMVTMWDSDPIEIHEVKGFWEDDARVKMKMMPVLFPEFLWVAVTLDKQTGWKFEYFKGA